MPVVPAESARLTGLAYTLWLPSPSAPVLGGIVVLHGAGSGKESHHDFARAALPHGLAAITFDQRGHGESDGPMDDTVLDDIVAMAGRLRERIDDPGAPIAVRGSSMGGYLAILAAPRIDARAVLAICPAPAEGLRRGLEAGSLRWQAGPGLDVFLAAHELGPAVQALEVPLLLLHAVGDEQVPVEHSRELAALVRSPGSRLVTVPGGHHRSIQHDEELQAFSLRFLLAALSGGQRS